MQAGGVTWRAHSVILPGLILIASEPLAPNPLDLVTSERLRSLVVELRGEVDVIINGTPPVLCASDSPVVTRRIDGVIVACRSHQTRLDAMQHVVVSIHQGRVRLVGVC